MNRADELRELRALIAYETTMLRRCRQSALPGEIGERRNAIADLKRQLEALRIG